MIEMVRPVPELLAPDEPYGIEATPLITYRDHVSHASSLFCWMQKNQHHHHPQYSRLACSAPGGTRPRAFSFAPSTDADADLAMLSCTTLSLFLFPLGV